MSSNPRTSDLGRLTRHHAFLASLAHSLVGQAADADDLAQEVWLAALSRPSAVERPRAWLATVARRLRGRDLDQRQRRGARERDAARDEALPSSESVAAELEISQRLTDAVRRLEEPLRSTIHLHYAEGASAREIARRGGLPLETVRSRIKRGLELLRRDLDGEFGGDRDHWCAALAPLLTLPTLKTVQRGGLFVMHWKLLASLSVLVALASVWSTRDGRDLQQEPVTPSALGSLREALAGTPGDQAASPDSLRASSLVAQEPPAPEPPLPDPTERRKTLPPSGSLVGQVRLEGELPELPRLDLETLSRGSCQPHPGLDLRDRRLRFDATGGLQDAVIVVEVPLAETPQQPPVTVVELRRDRFEPHVSIVHLEGRVRFDNADDANHNVHGMPRKNPGFNYTLPPLSEGRSFRFNHEESFELRDDLRPWMKGWVFVTGERHVTKTDEHGAFMLEGLPPGRYRVRAWHPTLGKLQVKGKADIEAEQVSSLTIVVPEKQLKKAKKVLRRAQ